MAQFMEIPPLPGVKDLSTLLDFMQNPDRAGEASDYLKKLETVRKAINANVKAVGTIKEIDSLVVQARVDRVNAATVVAAAKTKASKIISDANVDAGAIAANADDMDAEVRAASQQNVTTESELKEREREVSDRKKAVGVREDDATAKEERLEADKAQLAEKVAAFKQEADKLRAALPKK